VSNNVSRYTAISAPMATPVWEGAMAALALWIRYWFVTRPLLQVTKLHTSTNSCTHF